MLLVRNDETRCCLLGCFRTMVCIMDKLCMRLELESIATGCCEDTCRKMVSERYEKSDNCLGVKPYS